MAIVSHGNGSRAGSGGVKGAVLTLAELAGQLNPKPVDATSEKPAVGEAAAADTRASKLLQTPPSISQAPPKGGNASLAWHTDYAFDQAAAPLYSVAELWSK